MAKQGFINPREFYDAFDEKYEHDEITGIIRRRSDHRELKAEAVRIQIRGQRRHINTLRFIWWLYTSEIPEKPVIPKDGDYRNRRFENLELKKSSLDLTMERHELWRRWCEMSLEDQQAYLASGKPKPQPLH